MPRRTSIALILLAAVAAAAVVLRLMVGGGAGGGLAWPDSVEVWDLRSLRIVSGAAVGAALAIAGVMLQTLLRNPLASPDILGLSAGASLAVMLGTFLARLGWGAGVLGAIGIAGSGAGGMAPLVWQAGPALVGSMAALGLVYAISQRSGAIDPAGLVLVGVVISIMCGAGVMLLQHIMPGGDFVNWRLLVGSLSDDASWMEVCVVAGVALAGAAVGARAGPAMDALAMGDDEAASVGVRVSRLRAVLFLASGALTAAAVLLAGPVGFVGLICPHMVRLLAGAGIESRALVVGSGLAGAGLVVGADVLIKSIDLASGRLPLGVLTALAGGVVFLILLRRTRLD